MAWPAHTASLRTKAVKRPWGRLATLHPPGPLSPSYTGTVFAPWGPEAGIGEEPEEEAPIAEQNMFEKVGGKWEPVIGEQGTPGEEGPPGLGGILFRGSRTLEEIAPGPGLEALRRDKKKWSEVTKIELDNSPMAPVGGFESVFARLSVGALIRIYNEAKPSENALFEITKVEQPEGESAAGTTVLTVKKIDATTSEFGKSGEESMVVVFLDGPRDFGVVTALPTQAVAVGDRCTLVVDAEKGDLWELIYDGEGSLPWKKVGGPPLKAQYTAAASLSTEKEEAQSTNAPTIKLPGVKIDARISWGCNLATAAAAGAQNRLELYKGGAAVDLTKAATVGGGASGIITPHFGEYATETAASAEYEVRYRRTGGSGKVEFYSPWLKIDAVRVG